MITESGALLLRVEDQRFDDAVFISSNRAVTHAFLRRAAATSITEYGKVTSVREHLVAQAMGSPDAQGLASKILGTRFCESRRTTLQSLCAIRINRNGVFRC